MGDLTRNFNLRDFKCHCGCGLNDSHPLVVCGVQSIRDRLMAPVYVTSASRCEERNESAGGRPGSKHLPQDGHHGFTLASDIICPGQKLYGMFNAAEAIRQFKDGGIGLYLSTEKDTGVTTRFMHVDCRGVKARWFMLDGELVDVTELLTLDSVRPVLVSDG